MKKFFLHLGVAYSAEHIKLKGTWFYFQGLIFGALCPIIYFFFLFFQKEFGKQPFPYNYYVDFIQNVLTPYSVFFFPVLIIIMVSRITQFDHRNGGWQLMETQPLEKKAIYLSKVLVVLTVCAVSILSLIVISMGLAWALTFLIEIPAEATMGFEALTILQLITRLLVASLFLVAIQYCISVLIPSFVWSILIGIAGLLLMYFLTPFQLVPDWYPHAIISRISQYKDGSDLGYWFTYTEIVSLLFCCLILFFGFQWYDAKKLKLAYTRSRKVLLTTLAVVIGCSALIGFTLKPNEMSFEKRTVLSGKIESDVEIKMIYVKGLVDTLAIIPVRDNSFHYTFSDSILFDQYQLIFDQSFQLPAYFGLRDSTFAIVTAFGSNQKIRIYGSRLAENQAFQEESSFGSVVFYWIDNGFFLDKPEIISDRIYKEWDDLVTRRKKYKTVDNYVPKSDYVEREDKLVTAQFLNYWHTYQVKRAALHDTSGVKNPATIKTMEAKLISDDEALLADSRYLEFVLNKIIPRVEEDIDLSTKQLRAISKLPAGSFKDKLLYRQLSKSIQDASGKQDIDTLLSNYIGQFQSEKFKKIIAASAQLKESLTRGQPAPPFTASTLGNQVISLLELSGKLVVIDVWATWCGPCKTQSPYFEKFAIKYKNEPIQFVALSTDKKKQSWFIDAQSKSKSVMQLHVNDLDDFADRYDLQTIPRFILISATGAMINASMPYPSDDAFEILLRNELGLKDK